MSVVTSRVRLLRGGSKSEMLMTLGEGDVQSGVLCTVHTRGGQQNFEF